MPGERSRVPVGTAAGAPVHAYMKGGAGAEPQLCCLDTASAHPAVHSLHSTGSTQLRTVLPREHPVMILALSRVWDTKEK